MLIQALLQKGQSLIHDIVMLITLTLSFLLMLFYAHAGHTQLSLLALVETKSLFDDYFIVESKIICETYIFWKKTLNCFVLINKQNKMIFFFIIQMYPE